MSASTGATWLPKQSTFSERIQKWRKMDSEKDFIHAIRRHSTHSKEPSRGPLKATEAAISNPRRFSEGVSSLSPSIPSERRLSSGSDAPRSQGTPSNRSAEPDHHAGHHSSRPIASQSIDNAGLAMRRAMMLQRQNATTEDPSHTYDYLPCTPPRPPSQPRPKSAKGRPRSGSRPRSSSAIIARPMSDSSVPLLPPSPASFSRYKPLPSISTSRLSTTSSHSSVSSHSNENIDEIHSETNELTQKLSQTSLRQKTKPPPEPPEIEPGRINLAIKLLDGTRRERWFRRSDTIGDILCYAESVMDDKLPDNCEICTNELPKRTFSDLSLTLEDVGLLSRTVLYIQER